MSSFFDIQPPPTSPQSPPSYVPLPETTTVASVLLVFFFLGFFSIFLYRFIMGLYMANFSNFHHNAARPTGSAANGLDPSVIATFPKLIYSSVKHFRQDKCGVECAVCLLEFEDNDELRLLTVCNHAFHPECIDLWFGNHTTCPLCRRSLLPPEINVAVMDPPENEQQESEAREDSNSVSTKEDEEEEMVVVVVVEGGESHDEDTTSGAMASQDEGQNGEEKVERFSRCHSTGHSITHVEPDDDRYRLRLSDDHHVKDYVAKGHNWTGNSTAFGEFSSNARSGKPPAWLNCRGFPAVM